VIYILGKIGSPQNRAAVRFCLSTSKFGQADISVHIHASMSDSAIYWPARCIVPVRLLV
jgi:hypothetical protein